MSEPLRVGVVGLGRIGRVHLENLRYRVRGARVVAAADPSPEARSVVSEEGVETYEDFASLLEHPDMDAVAVCSPTNEHANHVMAAARRGKHVFCEKPLDLSLDRVREALAVVEECGIAFMIGFNRRFDANFVKVKETVAAGEVGVPHVIRITSRDPAPPPLGYIPSSGGLFLDMTIHDFDMARHLAASEVVEVYAKGQNLLDPEIGRAGDIDTAVCLLTFANGVTAVIDNSRQAVYGYDQRVEVFGSGGSVSIGNETPDRHRLATAEGIRTALPQYFFVERYAAAYVAEVQSFVDAVRAGETPPVGGRDALEALRLGLAAKESLRRNAPVTLSPS